MPFEGETESMYGGVASRAVVLHEGGSPRLRLSSSPNLPDVVVWNIGAEKAPGMKDLGDGEWRHYVCVEPGVLAVPAIVEPGANWVATHELRVLR